MKNNSFLLILLLAGVLLLSSTVQAQEDVGVSAILSPPDTLVLNQTYSLQAVVFNLGSQASSFDVVLSIDFGGSPIVADTVSVTDLANGLVDTVDFSATFSPTSEGAYDIESYTVLATDTNPSNDLTAKTANTHWGLALWFGNLTGTPIETDINSRLGIDVYVQTNSDVWVADCHICCGFNMTYFDSLLSETEGTWYTPLTEWDALLFYGPDFGQPAMPEGFGSQSFQGFSELQPPYESPFLNTIVPIRIVTFMTKTANDSSIIGETADAIVKGFNRIQGPTNASDTTGTFSYPIFEQHTPVFFRGAGLIRGVVTDHLGDPILNAEVIDLNSSRTTYTNSLGQYELENMFPGLHNVSFTAAGQRDTVVTDVSVPANGTRILNVQMSELPFDDVGVTSILSPPAFVQQNIDYALVSEIANMGTANSTFDVFFEAYVLGSPTPLVADTFNVTNLPGGQIDTVTFSKTLFTALDTTYEFISYTVLPADVDPANDTSYSSSSIFFGVNAWYGSIDPDPIPGAVGERLPIEVYMETVDDIYLSFLHLCLGADNQYIDSLLSRDEATLEYPFTEWDIAQFTTPQSTPPNSDGWSSQSFVGFSSIGSTRNPWLHYETPTHVMTMMTKVVDDQLLVGDTINCFGPGFNSTFGPSNARDTLVGNTYPIVEIFSPIYFKAVGFIEGTVLDVAGDPIPDVTITAITSGIVDTTDALGFYALDSVSIGTYDVEFSHPIYRDTIVTGVEVFYRETTVLDMVLSFPCEYLPGDVNSDDIVTGADVSYMVNYLRGVGAVPPDSCFNTDNSSWLYSAGDVNEDCIVTVADVSVIVNYFRALVNLSFCPFTPPPAANVQTTIASKQLDVPIKEPESSISMDMEDKR